MTTEVELAESSMTTEEQVVALTARVAYLEDVIERLAFATGAIELGDAIRSEMWQRTFE